MITDSLKELGVALGATDANGDNIVQILNAIVEHFGGDTTAYATEQAIRNLAEVIQTPTPNLQETSVTPTTSEQEITADEGYDGLSKVTVAAVTAAIDENIVAENIKDGVTILGVTGSYT